MGLQAQTPGDPYIALWSRLQPFDPRELGQMLVERRAVRMASLRGTVHLTTARDALSIRPLVQPALTRALYSGSPYGRGIAGVPVDDLLAAGRTLLEEEPRTLAQLRAELGPRWPDHDANALAYSVHYLLPLVQMPPRGVWGKSGRPVCTTAEHWLGQPLDAEASLDALILRYLAAFGPATPGDMRTWSGLTGLREVVERLRPRLRTFRDEQGRELFDLPDAPLPHPDTPAPPRFLPEYDNVLLSHADRGRIVSEANRARAGIGRRTVLIDGFVAGAWKIARARGRAALNIEYYDSVAASDRVALEEEGARLLTFLAPGAEHDLRVTGTG